MSDDKVQWDHTCDGVLEAIQAGLVGNMDALEYLAGFAPHQQIRDAAEEAMG